MDPKQFADTYLLTHKDFFPAEKIHVLKEKLTALPEDKQTLLQSVQLKNPTMTLILGLLVGGFGVDRMYINQIGLGIVKFLSVLILVGLIWMIIDWFTLPKQTKELNFQNVMMYL